MWSRFVADRRGGVAPMFAFALVPIIGLGGAAIDYSRGNARGNPRNVLAPRRNSLTLKIERKLPAQLNQTRVPVARIRKSRATKMRVI